jgi:phosphoglycerol transferase MdoB-like AlkP superfamily enzyme
MMEYAYMMLRLLVRPITACLAAGAAFVVLVRLENDVEAALFSFCGIALVAAFALVASNRVAFSIYSALCVALLIAIPSMVKARMTGMSLHSFDLALLVDPSMLAFFLTGFATYAVPVLVIAVCTIAFMTVIYRREKPARVTLLHAVLLVAAPILLYPLARPAWASDQSYLFHGRHLSALMASFEDLPRLWSDHPLAERIKGAADVVAYAQPFTCSEAANKPDIIIVHAESQLPPEWMALQPIASLQDSFRAQDGRVHSLHVETYGGGSWITVSSIMAGVSGADFGWMRQFISKSLVGNVSASVPEILSKCGYQTAAQLGMGYDQFSLGPLMSSLGVGAVDDSVDMGIESMKERDSRYFDRALSRIKENRALSQRPQFLYIETMFTHSPYDEALEPEFVLQGQPFSTDTVENEYLRRLVIARQDLESFKAQVAADPGERGTIILEYGDHRPMIELGRAGIDLTDWRSSVYETYFSFHGYGRAAQPHMAAEEQMDAAFLGYWLIEAGGIAHGGVIDDMKQLRVRCGGRFHLCDDRRLVDEVLMRRVNSDLLKLHPLLSSMRR